jgi:excisionase family DNA binding protein
MPSLNETLISSGEAARMLGIHPLAIQKLIRQGRLPAEKVANRWLISRAFLEEFARTYEGKRGRPRQKRKYTKRSPKWNVK